MTENTKIVIGTLTGLVIGFASGVLMTKKYFRKIYADSADKEIEDMKDYYEIRKSWEANDSDDEEIPDYDPNTFASQMSKLKERVDNKKEMTPYNHMYNDENKQDKDEETVTLEDKANEAHDQNKHKKPEIISEEAVGELPSNFDSQTLYLYKSDGIITDDCDNVIDEPAYLIGAALDKVDLDDFVDSVAFVANYELDVCYEIQILDSGYPGYDPQDGM